VTLSYSRRFTLCWSQGRQSHEHLPRKGQNTGERFSSHSTLLSTQHQPSPPTQLSKSSPKSLCRADTLFWHTRDTPNPTEPPTALTCPRFLHFDSLRFGGLRGLRVSRPSPFIDISHRQECRIHAILLLEVKLGVQEVLGLAGQGALKDSKQPSSTQEQEQRLAF